MVIGSPLHPYSEPTPGPVDSYSGGVLGKEEEGAQDIQTN